MSAAPTSRALRVGVTGHRLDKLAPGDLDALQDRLTGLLAALDAAASRRAEEAPLLLSGLAEGADRLAAEAMPARWRLDALLPLPRAEYRRDFLAAGEETNASTRAFEALLARADTVSEPDAADPDREAAYATLGRTLIRGIDCLLAVWDGQPARGPGGTAAVVAEAVALGVPVLWVDPTGRTPARLVTGFVGDDLARPVASDVDGAALEAIVSRMVEPQPASC